MATDQDWPSVWPAARTFNASVVPLPVRMGTRPNGNLELVKIPNFLHLTPAAIERHCDALKQFCTKFPKQLEDPDLLHKCNRGHCTLTHVVPQPGGEPKYQVAVEVKAHFDEILKVIKPFYSK